MLHLESVDLLEFGHLEGAVCVHALGLQVVQLRVPLLDLGLHVELLREHGAGLLVQLQAEGGQVVWNIIRHFKAKGGDQLSIVDVSYIHITYFTTTNILGGPDIK